MIVTDAPAANLTLDEFVKLPDSDRMELIDGVPVEKEEKMWRERIVQNLIGTALQNAQADNPLGYVGVEGLLRIDPKNPRRGRRPDLSFITFERMGDNGLEDEYFDICPDLCVEVVSPTNTSFEIAKRIAEFLAAGARLVWEVQPEVRAVVVYRPDGTARHVRGDEILSGEDVLPAFAVPVNKLFPTV